jgi:glycoside/pentoside/hexuronide:cation symporter, GPH family
VKKLPTLTKLIYGFGDISFSYTGTIIAAYFPIFLTDVIGIAPAMAAIALFIGKSWDYINDPLIGYISDRTRSRWGRRRPFLLFGALPFGLIFAFLWWKPPLDTQTALLVYYTAVFVLYDAASTFVGMPYFAMTPELTSDYDERTELTGYRMFFSILGGLISFVVPMMIIGQMSPGNAPNVFRMGLIFGLGAAIPLLLVFFGTREEPIFTKLQRPKLLASLKAAFQNRPFVFSAVIYLFTWTGMHIIEANLLYYIKYVVQREAMTEIIMATIFVTAILSLPLWDWISKKFNKRLAYIYGIAFWAVVQILLITVTAASSLAYLLSLCVLAGIGVGAAHVLPWAMIPDTIEVDELNTGERHEGMFYSLVMLLSKATNSIAVPLALVVLDISGYVPNAAVQPQSTLTGIRLVVGPIPAVLLVCGIVFAIFFPLSREDHQSAVQILASRRKAHQDANLKKEIE